MTKSTEELLRELESSGVLSGSSQPVRAPSRSTAGAVRAPDERGGSSGLVFLVVAAVVIGLVGSLPFGSYALYPFSLLVTLVHESCHALAAIASGGTVRSLDISPNLSGVTSIDGGWRVLIAPAGYLGSTVVGVVLLMTRMRAARWAIAALATFPLAVLFLFHPATLFTAVWAVLFAAALAGAAWRLPARAVEFLQIFLGAACGLNAFRDLMTLFFISTSRSGIHTDAATMSDVIPLPATVWAVIWTAMSLMMLVGTLIVVARRDVRRIRVRQR